MSKQSDLVEMCIENAKKVEAYDFSHLNGEDIAVRKLTGVKMTKKSNQTDDDIGAYTFDI